MGENAVLYATRVEQCPRTTLRLYAPGANVTVLETCPEGGWKAVAVRWSDLSIVLRDRSFADPELREELENCGLFVQKNWKGPASDLMRLLRRIARTRRAISVLVEPDLDEAGRAETLIFSLAAPSYSIVLFRESFVDPDTNYLMYPDGTCDLEAEIPAPESALERRERTRWLLDRRGIDIPATLPLAQADEEALLVDERDAAARALAIWATAVRAEGLERERVLQFVEEAELEDVLSPEERAFLDNPAPSQDDRNKFAWRYECLWALLWALGYVEELDFPVSPCDVRRATAMVSSRPPRDFVENAKLRDVAEILDACDLTYCCHWTGLESQVQVVPPAGRIKPEVAVERLRAFNWLVFEQYADWDDVRTDA